jgi:hypothetical protein
MQNIMGKKERKNAKKNRLMACRITHQDHQHGCTKTARKVLQIITPPEREHV